MKQEMEKDYKDQESVPSPEQNAQAGHESDTRITQRPLFRQLLICVTVWISYFVTGLLAGSPTPAAVAFKAKKMNVTVAEADPAKHDISSSIVFIFQEYGLAWVVILPHLMDYFGRRSAFAIVNFNIYLLLIVFFFSFGPTHTIISSIVLSLSLSCGQNISATILTEYIDPKYRGMILSIKSVIFFFGFWVSNAIGTFFLWKNIWFIAMACSAYFILILLCPESPYWLASKGKIKECAISHRWLRGTDANAEKELESILESQKECLKCATTRSTFYQGLLQYLKEYTSPEFYKPCLLIMLLFMQYYSTGKIIVTIYVLQVLSKITENEVETFTLLLYFDLFTVFAMCFGCILIRFFKRRLILTITCVSSIFLMLVTSVYLSLISVNILSSNVFIFFTLLLAINLILGCGPLVLCSTIFAELLSLKFKTSMLIISGVYLNFLYSITRKTASVILTTLSAREVFFLYSCLSSICFILLYKLLPETKDKTLLEIEKHFQGKNTENKAKLNAA